MKLFFPVRNPWYWKWMWSTIKSPILHKSKKAKIVAELYHFPVLLSNFPLGFQFWQQFPEGFDFNTIYHLSFGAEPINDSQRSNASWIWNLKNQKRIRGMQYTRDVHTNINSGQRATQLLFFLYSFKTVDWLKRSTKKRKLYRLWVIGGTKSRICGWCCSRQRLRSSNSVARALSLSTALLLSIVAWRWKYLLILIWLRNTLSATLFSALLNLRGMMEEEGQAARWIPMNKSGKNRSGWDEM